MLHTPYEVRLSPSGVIHPDKRKLHYLAQKAGIGPCDWPCRHCERDSRHG
jgi:hypothetical protein